LNPAARGTKYLPFKSGVGWTRLFVIGGLSRNCSLIASSFILFLN
jgi:hypothetical protein